MCPTAGLPHTSCQAHYDIEGSNCDVNGGWMRVGYVNMTEPGATCPQGLYKYTIGGKTLCDRIHTSSSRCDATFFSSNGLNYAKVCGQVRGYELGYYVDSIYPNYGAGSPKLMEFMLMVYLLLMGATHVSISGLTLLHAEDGNFAGAACPCSCILDTQDTLYHLM